MKTDFESALLGSGQLMKRGYAYLAENVGKAIAAITAAVAVLVSFTEIGFSDFSAESVTSSMILILISSYIIYFSLEDAGERLGRGGEDYKAAESEYKSVCEQISADMMVGLREFLTDYVREELKYRRSRILTEAGLSDKDYEAYVNGGSVTARQKRAFERAKKARPLSLTAAQLMSKSRCGTREEIKDPKNGKILRLLIGLLPTTLCTFFTLSVMLQTKDEMTAATVLEAILKLSCLPIIGLRGYSEGYSYTTERERDWLKAKTRLLNAFLRCQKEKVPAEKAGTQELTLASQCDTIIIDK